ncbi:MAG: dynamin family protein [Methanomicrobiales archaeon]|nr:dynamin family protein [Methanomicrobiales archaeon]
MTDRSSSSLNEHQARYLRVSCEHIDRLLGEIEAILNTSTSRAAFPRYAPDLDPARRRTIEDFVARLRAQVVRILDGQGIPRDQPRVPASRAIHATLIAIDIAAEELRPQHMRGYGEVSADVATELNGIAAELHGLVVRLDRCLAGGGGEDLEARLQRLEREGGDLRLLSAIERVVAERGLVEFRGTIASILDRAEDRAFEIAVFGRVSCGKSSLLNAILDTDALPVGVTPITAVPIHIAFGERAAITVSFAHAPSRALDIDRLGEYATEQQNPGNVKRVTRIAVTLPAPRLGSGVTFVDTPGLGSLATGGAAETLAYLPRCDLGVVMIDAGSTLTEGDIQTIRALQEAAVPVNVLLSKADLLTPPDCGRILRYIQQHLAAEFDRDLPVHPVSVRPSHRRLLDAWFEEEILPLCSRSQDLREASLRRKIGALRESVVAALRLQVQRSRQASPHTQERIRAAESRLRQATGRIEETRSVVERGIREMARGAPEICVAAAARMTANGAECEPSDVLRASIREYARGRAKPLPDAIETLALQLERDLQESAAALGIADAPEEGELASLVRGMPVCDPAHISTPAFRSSTSRLFGRKYAERRLAERMYRSLGRSLEQTLAAYGEALEEWAGETMDLLRSRFEGYAERYRALAEQSIAGREMTTAAIQDIERDLRLLESVPSGCAPDAFREEEPGVQDR